MELVGVCEVGSLLKDDSGGLGSVVVVDVMVVRRARRGRRKVGGRIDMDGDDRRSALPVLRANIVTTGSVTCAQCFLQAGLNS